ncbi:MAG: methyltransferase domain-containing protein [Planctomycetota bacterium]|nr:methyltransferase domain-containing protein [Planctomycetota bacterium]
MKLPILNLFSAAMLASLSIVGCASTDVAPAQMAAEDSVKPGINKSFLNPELQVDKFVDRFEGESREVFANRAEIAASIGIKSGSSIVDVGAGTGPYIGLFAQAVGPKGKVFAIDIAPKFVEHLADRAKREGHPQIEARLCSEDSVDLPDNSVDYAFICDVYHHFEFPRTTMATLHSALRPGGEVVIVDFKRIPGVSREWILGHVRAGKEEVFAEMKSFGFEMVEEIPIEGLEENWVARFRKS